MAENLIPVSMVRQDYILISGWRESQQNGVGGRVMEMSGISVPGAGCSPVWQLLRSFRRHTQWTLDSCAGGRSECH
jgi:hypothetical protein